MAAQTDFERLAVLIEANTKSYENAMKKLQRDTNNAIRAANKSVASLDAQMSKLANRGKQIAGILGASFGAKAFSDLVMKASDLGDTAEKIGMTAEALQELHFAASQVGVSSEALDAGLIKMSKFISEAQRGSKEANAELKALGLNIRDFADLRPEQAFELLASKISLIEDPIQRNAALIRMLGKSGAELANLMQLGANGIETMRAKARELGIVISDEMIGRMQEAGDKIDIIKAASFAAGVGMADKFIPALDALAKLVTSEGFQTGMANIAESIGSIVKYLAEHPQLAKFMLAAGGTFAVTKSPLLALGAGAYAAHPGVDVPAPGSTGNIYMRPKAGAFDSDMFNGGVPWGGPGSSKPAGSGLPGGKYTPPPSGDQVAKADAMKKRYEDMTRQIELQTRALYETDRQKAIDENVTRLGADATDEMKSKIAALTGELYDAKMAQEALNSVMNLFGDQAMDALDALIFQGKSLNEVFGNVLQTLAKAAIQATLLGSGPLAGLFGTTSPTSGGVGGVLGSLFSALIPRAAGGKLNPGNPYLVGENGPEVINPGSVGMIRPLGALGGANDNSAPVININFMNGAKGNQEIEGLVAKGVNRGLGNYSKSQARARKLNG